MQVSNDPSFMVDSALPDSLKDLGSGPHSFFFDFDGTLYPGESLDEVLAIALEGDPERGAHVEALEQLGRRGMEGTITFQESLRGRLGIVRPHRRHVEAWLSTATKQILPHWEPLLSDLRSAGHHIVVISGGFRACIEPIVQRFAVPLDDICCNSFRFENDGWVSGLDEEQPLSRSGGKPVTVARLVAERSLPGARIMIGDGATDLEAVAEGACHAMIGYGVHAVRPAVQKGADVFFERANKFDRYLRAHFT